MNYTWRQLGDTLGRASLAGKRRSPAERPKGATYQQEEASLRSQLFVRTPILIFVAAQLLLGAASLAQARSSEGGSLMPAPEYQAAIQEFHFQPMELTVPVGAKVTWTNKDEEPHTVVSTDNAFKSRALDTDESFSFTFDKPGTYQYFCSVHPRMTGKITVK